MKKRFSGFFKDESGVAAVEFALIGIILMALILSVLDISRLLSRQMDLNAAIRSGAELSMRGTPAGDVADAVALVFERTTGEVLDNVSVQTFCMCPNQSISMNAASVSCVAFEPCGVAQVPWVFHDLTATHRYDALFIQRLLDFDMSFSMRVQSP